MSIDPYPDMKSTGETCRSTAQPGFTIDDEATATEKMTTSQIFCGYVGINDFPFCLGLPSGNLT